MSCGQSHDGRSVAADEERHVRLHRPNAELVERHVVELAVEADGAVIQQRPQHADRFGEATNPRRRIAQRSPDRGVFGGHVAGAEPEDDATVGEAIGARHGAS